MQHGVSQLDSCLDAPAKSSHRLKRLFKFQLGGNPVPVAVSRPLAQPQASLSSLKKCIDQLLLSNLTLWFITHTG